jgi:mono/diheme cytochrome c family protein
MMNIQATAIGVMLCVAASTVSAQPVTYRLPRETAQLKPAAGADVVQANCGLCHSLDYITTQPPHRGAAFWQASVTKMIRIYGAELNGREAEIVAYLAANY